MRQLVLALYAEGHTDERFLPIIMQRVADRLLRRYAVASVDVLEPLSLKVSAKIDNRAQRILSAAKMAHGYNALIIHADADAATMEDALRNRYEPGNRLVQTSEGRLCTDLAPLIPIRMTEAWMMADFDAFQDVVGTDLSADDLRFPSKPHQVEKVRDPKSKLSIALNQIFSRRRRRKMASLGQYYEPLARRISLNKLEKIPAFQQFKGELANILQAQHFIRFSDHY